VVGMRRRGENRPLTGKNSETKKITTIQEKKKNTGTKPRLIMIEGQSGKGYYTKSSPRGREPGAGGNVQNRTPTSPFTGPVSNLGFVVRRCQVEDRDTESCSGKTLTPVE